MSPNALVHYMAHERERNNETDFYRSSVIGEKTLMALYVPQAVAAEALFGQIEESVNWDAVRRDLRRVWSILTAPVRALSRRPALADPVAVSNHLGVDLPLEQRDVEAMMEEVRRFKWLEAERAGRDIWAERHPENPDQGALREWFRLHFGAWYLARRKAVRA